MTTWRAASRQGRGPGLQALSSFVLAASAVMGARPAAAQEIPVAPCACTREYRQITLPVVDASGRAVPRWEAIVRRVRTGRVLRTTSSAEPTAPAGRTVATSDAIDAGTPPVSPTVLVVDDGMVADLVTPQDTLVVDVRAGARRGRARVIVGFTGTRACPCHVRVIAAPARIIVR